MFHDLLKKYGNFEFNYFFNLSLKHKYMYVEVPKSGSTSTKMALLPQELDSGGPEDESINLRQEPHRAVLSSPFIKPFQVGEQIFDNFCADKSVYIFTVVRNPFSRILSGYIEKILRGSPQFEALRHNLAAEMHRNSELIEGFQVSFVEFLRCIAKIKNPMMIDPHFRPQAFHASTEIIEYTKIFKLEDTADMLRSLHDISGLSHITLNAANAHSTRSSEKLKHYYTPAAEDLVLEIYEMDFKYLDYSRKIN